MFQSITFYIGGKTLGIYGEEFPLGALTTEVLNITPEEYQALDSRLQSAMEGMARYEKTHTLTDWHQANEQMLCSHVTMVQCLRHTHCQPKRFLGLRCISFHHNVMSSLQVC